MCTAHEFECHYYKESSKSLQIYCDSHRSQLPPNCTRESSSVNPLDVTHLKIEGCEQSFIGDASEKYSNIQSLNISQSGYGSLDWTGKIFKNVILLDVSKNELNTIPTKILSQFPQLTEIRLDENKIKEIFAGDFENSNQKLETISLTSNGLKSIDDNAFAKFNKLMKIYLSQNDFSTFPMEVFNRTNIRAVYLKEYPQLTAINCTLIRALGLTGIYFTWKYITTFDGHCNDDWKFVVQNWEYDELIWNSVNRTTFYCNTSKECFENMQYFVAGPTSFENIGEMLPLLGSKVTHLDLSGNHIYDLNATTFKRFQNLNYVNLSNTGLKTFSFEFLNNQTQLKHFDISLNSLDSIDDPKYLQNFTQLTYFNTSGNKIRNIDDILENMPTSIQQLILGGWVRVVKIFDVKLFSRLGNLTELNLNDIWGLSDDNSEEIDIGQMPSSLKRLNLHRTNLKQIKNLDLKHFPVLEFLDVSESDLKCDYLDKLQSEFEDITVIRDKCKNDSKFWVIFLASLATIVIVAIVILEKVRRKRS